MKFFSYWRSLAAFRVRIALNLKGIATDVHIVDVAGGHQLTPAYKAINPQGVVPALALDDGNVLFQSMAILEYLEETYPTPALLPKQPAARARVRGLAQIAVADGHPLITPRVRHYLEKPLGHDAAEIAEWSRHFMGASLSAIEGHLSRDRDTGQFCHGDSFTLADACLVSQVVGYGYFGGTPDAFPTIKRIHERCMAIDAVAAAHPLRQPDAPKAHPG